MKNSLFNFLFFVSFFFMISCDLKSRKSYKFLGTWTREEKMHPINFYETTYKIEENGDAFKVNVTTVCRACKNNRPLIYTFSGSYNQEKDVFELYRDAFPEILMIDDETGLMVSDRKPEFKFTKQKGGRARRPLGGIGDI